MRKLPRSLRFYVAASTLYAALIFIAVQFIYTIELAQSGIVIARRDNGDLLSSIQVVSFIVWFGISLIAAVIMYRLAAALAGAKSAEASAKTSEEQKDQELGSIFGLSSALAGPLELEQIGAYFVAAVRSTRRSARAPVGRRVPTTARRSNRAPGPSALLRSSRWLPLTSPRPGRRPVDT